MSQTVCLIPRRKGAQLFLHHVHLPSIESSSVAYRHSDRYPDLWTRPRDSSIFPARTSTVTIMTSSSGYNPLPPTQNGGQASWSDPVSSSSHNDVKGNAFASDGGHQSLDIGAFNHGQPSLKQDSYGGKLETNANNSSALPPEIDPDFLNIPSYFVNTQSVDASNGSLAGSYDLASAAAAAADTSGEFVTANSGPETFADGAVAEEEAVASGSGQGTTGKVKGKRIKLPLACHFCRRRKLK